MCKKLIYVVSFVLVLSMAGNTSADLVVHWGFDEGSGSVVHDTSGNGHDGTINGTPQWVPGIVGGALHFDGSTYVAVGDAIGTFETFSIALWFKYDSFIADWNSIWHNNGWTSGFLHHMVTNYSGQDIRVQFAINGAGDQFGVTPIETDVWYHSTVTYDSTTGQMNFYLTTDEERMVNLDVALTVSGPATNITAGQIGGWEGNRLSSATFDDIRMYDHILSEAEILSAMAGEIWPYAWGPVPADGDMLEATWMNLGWKPGGFAVSHDVYIGENFDDVNAGAEGTFQGNQTAMNLIVGFPGFAYPDGLVPGTTYYWRIDEVNDADPNSPWKGEVWSFWIPPRKAYNPIPADDVKFVKPDAELNWTGGFNAKLHYVFFGDNFDDVNNAVVGLPQSETNYTPGTLELDKVYYWRIDEFDGVNTYKGDVWSFRTLPDIAITDPSLVGWWTLDEGMGSNALDWSGHGNHGVLFDPEWAFPGFLGNAALSFDGTDYVAIQNLSYNSTDNTELTVCAWIRTSSSGDQYIASFDRNEYWRLEINGNGAGDGQVGWDLMTSSGQVDYGSVTRVDDGLWHHVTGVYNNGSMTIYIDGRPEPSASGGNTFGSGTTRFGFIGANSEASNFNGSRGSGSPIAGEIDELRIYHKALTQEEIQLAMRGDPSLAWGPSPSQGSTLYIRDATPLSWSPGDNASQHDVYFGTDRDAVVDADASDTTGIYRGRQGVTIYTPSEGVEWGGGPYYWRVDEYNTDATISKGNVWTFTVTDFIGIDDFEDYNDYPPDEIFSTWIDGWEVPTNGSLAGHADPPFAETGNVHGGRQSMPVYYENNFKYSEITMTLVWPRDWTEEGVGVLSLWFYGDAANAAERMYVALNGIATVYHGNPDAVLIEKWTEWAIDLQEFAAQGVNLANVNTISIGFGDKNNLQAGGSGMLLFDDIRLYRPSP